MFARTEGFQRRARRLLWDASVTMPLPEKLQAETSAPSQAPFPVRRIWDHAPHNAFPDLIAHGDGLLCALREGADHVSEHPGSVRVLRGTPAGPWTSVAYWEETGIDLRDPHLSSGPNGRVFCIMGATLASLGGERRRVTKVASADDGLRFGPLQTVELPEDLRSPRDWLWRLTWREDVAWGAVYQTFEEEFRLQLVRSHDGVHFEHVTRLDVTGRPSETTLRFLPDETLLALVRRGAGDQHARLGRARPPYTDWTWTDFGRALGGPELSVLPDGRLLAAGRRSEGDFHTTVLFEVEFGEPPRLVHTFPSGGDTSYPGLVLTGDELQVVYYSSHEERTAIYLATLPLAALERP